MDDKEFLMNMKEMIYDESYKDENINGHYFIDENTEESDEYEENSSDEK